MGLPQDTGMPKMDGLDASLPYPARTKQVAGEVNGVKTDVTSISFSDKIMITITQGGRLAQWLSVPLHNDNPTQNDMYLIDDGSAEDSLLPSARFTPRPLLGSGSGDRETMGQLYASQIASAITTKTPDEARTLTLGLGLAKVDIDRDTFLQVIDLVLQCI